MLRAFSHTRGERRIVILLSGTERAVNERKSFLIRVDKDVLDMVQTWADDELRSLNGQIEFILREALRRAGRLPKTKRTPLK